MKVLALLVLAVLFLAACGRNGTNDIPDGYDAPIIPGVGGQPLPGGQQPPDETQPATIILPPREAAPIAAPAPPVHLGGLTDMRYELVIPPRYQQVSPFENGVARVFAHYHFGQWRQTFPIGLINTEGEYVFSAIDIPGRGMTPLREIFVHEIGEAYNGVKWIFFTCPTGRGLITRLLTEDGRTLYELPPGVRISGHIYGYDMVATFRINQEQRANSSGIVTVNGQEILPLGDMRMVGFSEGMGVAVITPEENPNLSRVGFVNAWGDVIIPPRFHAAGSFAHGVAAASTTRMADGPRWGLIDMAGNPVIIDRYSAIHPFSGGLARVERSWSPGRGYVRQQGFINSMGELVIPYRYMNARCFSEGMAAFAQVYLRGDFSQYIVHYWGFMNSAGVTMVEPQFYAVRDFAGGMAAVAVRHDDGQLRWGFVNTHGELVIPPTYTWVSDFADGYAVANTGGETYGMWAPRHIDAFDREISPQHRIYQVVGGDFTIIDTWGRMALYLPGFDAVGQLSEGMLPVNRGRALVGPANNRQIGTEGQWGFVRLIK